MSAHAMSNGSCSPSSGVAFGHRTLPIALAKLTLEFKPNGGETMSAAAIVP